MRNSKQFLLFFSMLMLILQSAIAQREVADTLVKRFDAYRLKHLQEKLYVHCDRSSYLTGEIIWFKIYCTDGTLHQPLNISKVAYVELVDQNNTSLLKGKISMTNGIGDGSFYLPASLLSGHYILRAYTNWMKNNSPEFFFHKELTIINTFLNLNQIAEKNASSHTVDFFPEGGPLINGIKSKVAFAIKDNDGKGIDCKVALVNEQNDTIALVKPFRFGLGYFYYMPRAGSQERVVVIDSNKKISTHKLPLVVNTGYGIHLSDSTDQYLHLKVMHSASDNLSPWVVLFVHTRQAIVQAEVKSLNDTMTVFHIDKSKLGEGISHITLFDGNLKPMCERLYFKYPKKKLELKIESEQLQYQTRRKVNLKLSANVNSKPATAKLSATVYKSDSLNTTTHNGIYEYLWLSSDLSGRIESPEYYFTESTETEASIDLVMLTHGWRRFQWKDALKNEPLIKFLPEYYSHVVQGKITDANGTPVSGEKTYLASPNKVTNLHSSISNESGRVKFEVPDFRGPRQLIVQTPNNNTLRVSIENPFSETFAPYKPRKIVIDPALKNALMERNIFMQILNIYYEGQRDIFLNPKTDTIAFYGKAPETYYLDDYTRFPVMEEVLREYVPGVRVRKHNDKFVFVLVDNASKATMNGEPMILLDGVPVRKADDIMAFDPKKVKRLEVITRPFYLGPTIQNGIVSFSTYAGDLEGFAIDPNALTIDYEGLQLQREFHQPVYTTTIQKESNLPDFRNLLGWFPNIATDTNGKGEIEFYTSDLTGDYIVVVEGLTESGYSGSGSYSFKVKDSGH